MTGSRVLTNSRPRTVGLSLILILCGSWMIAAMAQLSIPIGPVPISGQTLGVFLVAIALGPVHGMLAVITYLAQGIAGLPVFAGGMAGAAVLMGPTGGYLIGFIAAAWIAGQISARRLNHKPTASAALLVLATASVYLLGAARLSTFVGGENVISIGVTPFLFGDVLKAGIAVLAAPMISLTKNT